MLSSRSCRLSARKCTPTTRNADWPIVSSCNTWSIWTAKGRARITASSVWPPWGDGVVPLAMKGMWFDAQGFHLIVGDLDGLLISIGIKLTSNGEAGLGG